MDLNNEAIRNLERLKHLREQKLQLEVWDIENEMPIGSNREVQIYNLRKKENVIKMSENVKMRNDIKEIIKHINKIQPIKIPLDRDINFARIAQGSKVSSAVLPSGLKMYHRIDNYEWVVRNDFAVLEEQFISVD